ncbi:Rieske (2Fe-2S) protein [Flavobacterium sp. C3NV]|jgi:nitrite reductase/ring-hydroxylating ferredoxin subunit|uniref:Rieske (2Fe-2S) protein n=1 Tax=Flavobacterium sp. C3NV TaxID=3393358 RepID=UPI00398F9506
MKKFWLLIVFVSVLISCSDNGVSNKNPNIPSYPVNLTVDMNLPAYSNLKFPSNGVIVPNYGAKGIIIFNTGSGYNAFDAACPNQAVTSCIAMTINGIYAVCSCDKTEYSLYTGLGGKEYPLKQYRVEVSGSVIHVYN